MIASVTNWNRFAVGRLACLVSVVALFVWADGRQALAQQKGLSKPIDEIVVTKDGWQIHLTYYKSNLGKNASVVILLHKKGGNRRVWTRMNGFATTLQSNGHAVIAVDLRKHGESKSQAIPGADDDTKKIKKGGDASSLRPVDYVLMISSDLEAVKEFIYEEHQKQNLNMRKLAIIAPEMSAPIALNFASNDWAKKPYNDAPTLASRTPRGWDVQALVLLSPEPNLPGVTTTPRAITFLRDPAKQVRFLVLVGNEDPRDKGKAQRLYRRLGGANARNNDRMYFSEYNSKFRGSKLLGKNLKTEEHIQVFLEKHLKRLIGQQYEWRNRQSRLK